MSSIITKLKAMRDFLNANPIDSASAYITDGQNQAYELLRNAPGVAKIALGFSKGVARSNFPGGDITGRENEYFYAIISRGKGLNQDRAANIVTGSGGGKPLIELAEILRDGLRTLQFDPATDERTDYVSIEEWGLLQGFNIDGFKINIWVGTQMTNFVPITENLEQSLPT